MRVGFDIDGVLADFNASYIALTIQLTGRDLFPPRPFDILTWNYPEAYGYTNAEVSEVWKTIKASSSFWVNLEPYPETRKAMHGIQELITRGHDVYFVTSRPGREAKAQTEKWLANQTDSWYLPVYTVLIASDKGAVAAALDLDYYIDDKWENVVDVVNKTDRKSYILNRPWNTTFKASVYVLRVNSVLDFLDILSAND